MKHKSLVIAPHPDDEINLAGQFIITLQKKNWDVYVLFVTNGDATKKIGNKRIYEAMNSCKVFGIEEEKVILLGYPNEWKGNTHLYNCEPDTIIESKLGKQETNSVSEYSEYCYRKWGIHHSFTRKNFKIDMKSVILDIMPEMIICPEFDSHPDHRATSLMFDEIMGEILKEIDDYCPIIFKKYIHEGVWNGPKDYYNAPPVPTVTQGERFYSGAKHELDSPCFKWMDRLAFSVDANTVTPKLSDNIIYKAAKKHKLTTAWYEMQRVINSDVVYWLRPSNNIALRATVTSSSGEGKYVNDFKRYDSNDILSKENYFSENGLCCWKPELNDEEKEIILKFNNEKTIHKIVIFEDCCSDNHIKRALVCINGEKIYDGELHNLGLGTEIVVSPLKVCDEITVQIKEWVGNPGISEIEIYDQVIDYENLMNQFSSSSPLNTPPKPIGIFFEKCFFVIKFLLSFKIMYELKRLINH